MERVSCTGGTRTSAWSSTGAGGWSTSGWKASSRSSQPRSSPSCSLGWACCRPRSPPRPPSLPPPSTWPEASSEPITTCPPVLLGHSHRGPGVGRDAERARGGALGPDRLSGDEGPEELPSQRMGAQVSLAHLLLHRRRLLEPGG